MAAISRGSRKVRELRKLLRKSAYRDELNTFVIEGYGLLEEAIATGNNPIDVFVAENDEALHIKIAELGIDLGNIWHLDPVVLKSIASTQTPQPVLATLPIKEFKFIDLLVSSPDFLVVGVEISDPGNAGTIIRTAAAAGASGVVFSQGSVDLFNPKVVRASAGAIFRVPVFGSVDMDDLFIDCAREGLVTLGLCGGGERQYDRCDFTQPLALLVGNESRGLTDLAKAKVTEKISIPMKAGVESLNAAAALSIVAFEVRRQRASND